MFPLNGFQTSALFSKKSGTFFVPAWNVKMTKNFHLNIRTSLFFKGTVSAYLIRFEIFKGL